MTERKNIRTVVLPPSARFWRGAALGIGAVVVAAACIPLAADSTLPVVNRDFETWLVIAGKMCGVAAGTLMLFQLLLGARLRWLDRIYGLNRLFDFHRVCGVCAVIFASFHPMLMFAPETVVAGPLSPDLWPVFLGAVLLVSLWAIAGVAIWRIFLNLSFDRWWFAHRLGVFMAVVLLAFHSFNVSDDFDKGWPRCAFFAAVGLYAIVFAWVKVIKPVILKKGVYRLTNVIFAGKDAYGIELTPEAGHEFESGRLDESKLRNLLAECSRRAMVFVCGPPKMMESVHVAIRRIGFSKRAIKMERFAL